MTLKSRLKPVNPSEIRGSSAYGGMSSRDASNVSTQPLRTHPHVLISYKSLFSLTFMLLRDLERQGLLNPSDDFDIFVLHVVARKLLENAVAGFKDGWNQHPLSTEGNFSPTQLFHGGLLSMRLEGGYHAELNQVFSHVHNILVFTVL